MNGNAANNVVDDAVGIFCMINPVMARMRLGRVNVRPGDVAAGIVNLISYPYIMVFRYEAD